MISANKSVVVRQKDDGHIQIIAKEAPETPWHLKILSLFEQDCIETLEPSRRPAAIKEFLRQKQVKANGTLSVAQELRSLVAQYHEQREPWGAARFVFGNILKSLKATEIDHATKPPTVCSSAAIRNQEGGATERLKEFIATLGMKRAQSLVLEEITQFNQEMYSIDVLGLLNDAGLSIPIQSLKSGRLSFLKQKLDESFEENKNLPLLIADARLSGLISDTVYRQLMTRLARAWVQAGQSQAELKLHYFGYHNPTELPENWSFRIGIGRIEHQEVAAIENANPEYYFDLDVPRQERIERLKSELGILRFDISPLFETTSDAP